MKMNNRELFEWDFSLRNGQVGGTIANTDTPTFSFDPDIGNLSASFPTIDPSAEKVEAFLASGSVAGIFQVYCTIINSIGETITRGFALKVE